MPPLKRSRLFGEPRDALLRHFETPARHSRQSLWNGNLYVQAFSPPLYRPRGRTRIARILCTFNEKVRLMFLRGSTFGSGHGRSDSVEQFLQSVQKRL